MSKIFSHSLSKSFGGYSFYNSNKNINEYLHKKKTKRQLSDNGFKNVNITVEAAIKKIEREKEVWIFPPRMFDGKITQSGFKNKGKIFSHYGKVLAKWKCHNGNVYLYSTKIQVLDEFRKVYVFTDCHRKIIKELWTL